MTSPASQMPEDPSSSGREDLPAMPAPASPVADANPPADASPAPADPLANADALANAASGDTWSEIQAMFVDDPRRSVAEAASMVDGAISAFIDTAREQQASLASSWQDQGAGTEELRVALKSYRAFWSSMVEPRQPA
jgi:hypothetical protein